MFILSQYGVVYPEVPIDGSLDELLEDKGFLPRTSGLLVRTGPDWMSIPMFIPEDIVGKGLLKLETVVELLKGIEEKDNLFADFPIGTTIQDGGKRKRSNC